MGKTNAEIAHIWAQNNSEIARTSNGNFSCRNNRLYSYNTCIARFYGEIPVYTTHTYSVTTSGKHMNPMHKAINYGGYGTALEIDDLPDTWEQFVPLWIAENVKSLEEQILGLSRKRSSLQYHIDAIARHAQKLQDFYLKYLDGFNFDDSSMLSLSIVDGLANNPSETIENELSVKISEKLEAQKEQEKKRKAKEKEQARIRALEASERLKLWEQGENVHTSGFYDADIVLRLSNDKQEIETSHGAKIPVKDAVLLWHKYSQGESIEGLKVGYYTVDSCENNILKVGCHNIPTQELSKMANVLGL